VTGEPSADREPMVDADGETRSKRAASEIAARVAEQVRGAIEEAERSAQALRSQALDDATARRGAVHDRATQVLARIDELEDRLTRTLRELRGQAAQIAKVVEASSEAAEDRGRYADRFAREDESTWRSPASAGEAQPSDAAVAEELESAGAEGDAAAEQSAEELASPGAAAEPAEAPSSAEPAAEPAGEAAGPETRDRGPISWPADEADSREESDAEHPPHGAARRRRPGLFRHRRDG
jgi:hypothetical protein